VRRTWTWLVSGWGFGANLSKLKPFFTKMWLNRSHSYFFTVLRPMHICYRDIFTTISTRASGLAQDQVVIVIYISLYLIKEENIYQTYPFSRINFNVLYCFAKSWMDLYNNTFEVSCANERIRWSVLTSLSLFPVF
jgi:hypothetical protein